MRDVPPAEASHLDEPHQPAASAPAPEDAFRAWFGNSRVVDDSGQPLVVYHGTAADFAAFSDRAHRTVLNREYQGDGFHFSESPEVASDYADATRNQSINKERAFELADKNLPPLAARTFKSVVDEGYEAAWELPEPEIMAVLEESRAAGIDLNDVLDLAEYVDGSNYHKGRELRSGPIDIFRRWHHSLPEWVRESAVRFGLEDALPTPAVMPVYLRAEKVLRTGDPVAARNAQANGYDGVYYTGEGTVRGEPEWIVFRPEQIKSAIGNRGTYSLSDPDLRHSEGEAEWRAAVNEPASARAAALTFPAQPGAARNLRGAAFAAWFDGSKIVDADGQPLVVYHGTWREISIFDGDRNGLICFSDSAQFAAKHAADHPSRDGDVRVMPVYLSVKNPWDYRNESHVQALVAAMERRGPVYDEFADDLRAGDWQTVENMFGVLDAIRSVLGHDGLVVAEGGGTTYAVLRPEQIKSAIGNRGTYSRSDPDLRHSLSGPALWGAHVRTPQYRRSVMKDYTPRRAALERWLEDAPEYILDVFDNKGKTVDRYTVLFTGPLLERDARGEVRICYLGLSDAPTHPQGFSQWGEMDRPQAAAFRLAEGHQRIRWLDLPEQIRRHVIARATQTCGEAQPATLPARERQR